MQYRLDYSHKQVMQISNDALYYLLMEEEPLDDDNLVEAQEIIQQFPLGYEIEEGWTAIDGTDLVECAIVPYVENDWDFDLSCDLTKYLEQQLKWLDADHVRYWLFNKKTGVRVLRGDIEVFTNQYGNRYFCSKGGRDFDPKKESMFFLSRFKKHS